MPLPKPRSGEKQNDWTDRCMSDPAMVDEFPDADQRYALCMDAWRDRGAAAAAAGGGGAMYLQVRDALASGSLEIDRDNHELRNVSLITAGPADGHDFEIDAIMLAQVAESIGQGPGVKCRLTHPELSGGVFGNGTDGVEVMLGRARQPRVAGNKVYGTVHFGSYARKVPGKGDVEGYLMDLAAEDPDQVGLSIGFVPDKFEVSRDEEGEIVKTLGRIKRIVAVDFVGSPAANPAGLLSATQNAQNQPGGPGPARAPQRSGGIPMNPKLLEYLTSIGLKAEATEAEAVAFWNTRQGDEKLKADALAAGREPPAAKQSQPPVARQGGKQGDEAAGKQGDPPAMLSAEQAEAVQLLAREAERKRFREVTALAGRLNLGADWASEQVLSDRTLEQIKDLALDKVAEARKPVYGGGYVELGVDRNLSTLGPAISDAILLRAGAPMVEFDPDTRRALRDDQGRLQTREPHERARSFRSLSLVEIGRTWLTQVGVPDVGQLGRTRVAELILSPGRLRRSYGHVVALAQSTSDFPYILEDAIGRRLRAGYEEAEKTWPAWVRRVTHPDFKDIKPVALSESPDLATRPEGGEIKYVTLSETRETYALVEYAGGIRVTRRMIVNDDLGAFDRIPQLQSAAAARKEDDVVYSILTTNAALADTIALFHASHSNYVASGSGAAPSVATLDAAELAIGTQTGPKGATLNLRMAHIIAPRALRGTVLQLLNSTANPAAAQSGVANIWQNGINPIFEARLNANSTTKWYCAADYNQIDTIEICFLEDEQVPQLKSETDFDTDDQKFAVRHTVAAKAIDHRGLYLNWGA